MHTWVWHPHSCGLGFCVRDSPRPQLPAPSAQWAAFPEAHRRQGLWAFEAEPGGSGGPCSRGAVGGCSFRAKPHTTRLGRCPTHTERQSCEQSARKCVQRRRTLTGQRGREGAPRRPSQTRPGNSTSRLPCHTGKHEKHGAQGGCGCSDGGGTTGTVKTLRRTRSECPKCCLGRPPSGSFRVSVFSLSLLSPHWSRVTQKK